MEEEEETGGLPVYETGGAGTMMSEIFNFPSDGAVSATELLETQISQSYRNSRAAPPTSAADWFSHRISADSEAAMQLFPTPPHSTSSTLHMLLPNPSSSSSFGQFTWFNPNENNINNNPNEIPPGVVGGQRLSLSLSSSLQHMGGGAGLHLHGGVSQNRHSSDFTAAATMLRNSKYAKAAQDLLEEFCSVGRGQFKKRPNNSRNPSGGGGGGGDGNAAEDHPPLSASDRLDHQRRKVKLLAMLDEVDRRYNHYCEQMQMVVNSFDMMMGFGAASPYTSLAQKAMSRHFRCLKDAIAAQLKHSCELLGEKDGAGTSGVTKGETPRLRILEQSLRQQRAFQQMGIMEQEAWRPQRGLPERSVNVLRAWLFEHFLHPYPSDADKHLLARQTGLSRNQVSNWFINARVRLWKPMVEDMYQQEAKDEEKDQTSSNTTSPDNNAQIPTPPPPPTTTTATATFTTPPTGKRPEINAHENDPSFVAINAHFFSENQANYNNVSVPGGGGATSSAAAQSFPAALHETDTWRKHAVNRFGTSGGDVSLTLGLRHGAGNLPEKSHNFSVRDFGGC